MHRHGYKGRKFSRTSGQRLALVRSISLSLVENGEVVTTLQKSKSVVPFVEKLVTRAKKGNLQAVKLLSARLNSSHGANRLVAQIAPSITRSSGFLRVKKLDLRRGDNAEMVSISFVDTIKEDSNFKMEPIVKAVKATKKAKSTKKTTTKAKPAVKKKPVKKPVAKKTVKKTTK